MRYDQACAILGVPLGASDTAIHLAWRQCVKRVHPDRNQGRVLNERATKELNEARRVAVQMRPVHLPRSPSERKSKTVVDWDSVLSNAQAAVRRKPGGARPRPQSKPQPRSTNVWGNIAAVLFLVALIGGLVAAVTFGTGLVTLEEISKLMP